MGTAKLFVMNLFFDTGLGFDVIGLAAGLGNNNSKRWSLICLLVSAT